MGLALKQITTSIFIIILQIDTKYFFSYRAVVQSGSGPSRYWGFSITHNDVDSSWNVMAHGDAREGKRKGNWRMERVASTLLTTSDMVYPALLPTIRADAHTSAASSRLNWHPRWFKWARPFRRKMKSGFCACAITFQLASTTVGRTSLYEWSVRCRDLYLPSRDTHNRQTSTTPAEFEPTI